MPIPDSIKTAYERLKDGIDRKYFMEHFRNPATFSDITFHIELAKRTFHTNNNHDVFSIFSEQLSQRNSSQLEKKEQFKFTIDTIFLRIIFADDLKTVLTTDVYRIYTPDIGVRGAPDKSAITIWYDEINSEKQNDLEYRFAVNDAEIVSDFCLMAGQYFFEDLNPEEIVRAENQNERAARDVEHFKENRFKQFLDSLVLRTQRRTASRL